MFENVSETDSFQDPKSRILEREILPHCKFLCNYSCLKNITLCVNVNQVPLSAT